MKVVLTKLDVAKRQLETACWLYFQDGDPVSIHTLTAASYEVLHDLLKKKGGKTILKDASIEWAKPEYRDVVRQTLNAAQNFFKHADRDPQGAFEFNPDQTSFLLWEACGMYQTLAGERVKILTCFQHWFNLHNYEIFTEEKVQIIDETVSVYRNVGKQQFLTDCMGFMA